MGGGKKFITKKKCNVGSPGRMSIVVSVEKEKINHAVNSKDILLYNIVL